MKTKHNFKLSALFALLITFLAFSPNKANAQCPTLQNSLNCPVTVTVTFYVPDAMGTCTRFCNAYITNVNPGQIIGLNCALCPPFCNVSITIGTVGGLPATGFADFSTLAPGNPVTGTSPCLSSTSRIFYNPGMIRFRILP